MTDHKEPHSPGWLCVVTIALAFLPALPASADPPVTATPTSETLTGISYSPDGQFGVAVGNAGVIVHFDAAHPAGLLVPSGGTGDLYDVHVISADFAVASGEDRILIWDGMNWVEHSRIGIQLPIWATPEQDRAFFDTWDPGGFFTGYLNGFDPQAGEFLPGAYAGPLNLTFCGHSGNISVLNENGDLEVMDNDRGAVLVDAAPLSFDQPAPLGLTAGWIPTSACNDPALPDVAFGVSNFNDIWAFDGSDWQLQQDIPADQTITWIKGTAADNVLAVGYQDSVDSPGSNQGVIWQYDGSSWTDITATLFPSGEIPGLTDLEMIYGRQTCVHGGGFEDDDSAAKYDCEQPAPDIALDGGDFFLVELAGEGGQMIDLNTEAPVPNLADIHVSISRWRDDGGPATDRWVMDFTVRNLGPADAHNVKFWIYITPEGTDYHHVAELTCPALSQSTLAGGTTAYHGIEASIPADTGVSCEFRSAEPIKVSVSAYADAPTDPDFGNNRDRCQASDAYCNDRYR